MKTDTLDRLRSKIVNIDAMPAIPVPAERNVGGIYETLKGKLKWTGTGWVQP